MLAFTFVGWRTPITGWFLGEQDAAIADLATQLALLVWPLFLVNVTNIILSCYLTSIQRPGPAALIALMRGLVLPSLLLILLYVLPKYWAFAEALSGSSFIIALPLAEWLTFGLALVVCYRHRPGLIYEAQATATIPKSANAPFAT
jgi:Na+-driven multidrug efflux pump